MLLSTKPFETEREYRGSLPSPAPCSILLNYYVLLLHRLFRMPHFRAYYRTNIITSGSPLHHHQLLLVNFITLDIRLIHESLY